MNSQLLTEEVRALLLGVLPLFTSSYNHESSVKSTLYETYHLTFCAESQILEKWLIEQDTKTLEHYLDVLEKILALFERLVKPEALSSSNTCLVCINIFSYSVTYEATYEFPSNLDGCSEGLTSSVYPPRHIHETSCFT
jgi:hypothetical protein